MIFIVVPNISKRFELPDLGVTRVTNLNKRPNEQILL